MINVQHVHDAPYELIAHDKPQLAALIQLALAGRYQGIDTGGIAERCGCHVYDNDS